MEKNKKYISLELAKELRKVADDNNFELPEGEYCWGKPKRENSVYVLVKKINNGHSNWDYVRTYDVPELGEMLPNTYKKTIYHPKNIPSNNEYKYEFIISFMRVVEKEQPIVGKVYNGKEELYYIAYSFVNWRGKEKEGEEFRAKTEAEARGKMYLYLIKNKLI